MLTRGFIVEGELQYTLQRQASTGGPIGEILVDLGLITERDLLELLAEQLRMEVVDRRASMPTGTLSLIPKTGPRSASPRCRCGASTVRSRSRWPTRPTAKRSGELTRLLGSRCACSWRTRADIEAAVERLYDESDS